MATVNAFRQIQVGRAQVQKIDEGLSIKDRELLLFTKSFRDLYEAGLPINQNLRHLQQTNPNERLALAIGLMVDDLENGKRLSEAMSRFPNMFGEEYRSMIRAAEKSGNWTRSRDSRGERQDGILELLVRYIKRRNSARDRVKSGLLYPAIIILIIIAALAIFAFYILPSLRLFFDQTGGAEMGLMTRGLFAVGSFIEHYWWAIPLALVGSGFFCWYSWRYGNAQQLWMKYQLRIKPFGPFFVRMNLGHLLWIMGTLFAAGLTPQEVLDIVIETTRNSEIARALEKAREHFYNGIPFCDSLKRAHRIFEGQTYMVVATAQKNGSLDTALQNYAEEMFEDVDQNIDRAVKLIEPVLITVIGVIVGLIAIAYYSGFGSAVSNIGR